MQGDVQSFYSNLRIHFGEPRIPKDANLEDFIKNFAEDLAGYSDNEYFTAAKKLRTDPHASRSFPTNGVILAACREAKREIAVEAVKPKPAKVDMWCDAAKEQADKLVCSPLGRQAARDGWILCLWHFCREHGRLPLSCTQDGEDEIFSVQEIQRKQDEIKANPGSGGYLNAVNRFLRGCAKEEKRLVELVKTGKAA